jgi:hypothetical protein
MTDTTDTQATADSSSAQDVPGPQAGPPDPAPAAPEDVSPPLAALIASIRAAVSKGASPEARAAGATACRSILTVLEAKPGQSLASNAQPAGAQSPIAALLKQPGFLTQLAAMSREQLLDLLKQVTGAMPARSQTPSSSAPRFHLIQIPQVRRPDGT